MSINLNDIDDLVMLETLKVIRETLDVQLDNEEERARQKKMAKAIDTRGGLHASDEKDETNEAEDEDADEETGDEAEAQPTGVPGTIDRDTEATPQADRTGGKGTKDSPKLDTPTKKELAEPTVGVVIDKLNALRGGRSLKDPGVKKSFSQYFKNLTHQERTSLLAFLTGMSQILAGVADGSKALDPGDVGLRVKDTEKTINIKKDASMKGPETKSKRPGTEAQPIIVGERRHRALNAYKRHK